MKYMLLQQNHLLKFRIYYFLLSYFIFHYGPFININLSFLMHKYHLFTFYLLTIQPQKHLLLKFAKIQNPLSLCYFKYDIILLLKNILYQIPNGITFFLNFQNLPKM